jgi:hypothetical protein
MVDTRLHGKHDGAVVSCGLVEELPQWHEPTPSVLEVLVAEGAAVLVRVDGIVTPTHLRLVDPGDGGRYLLDLVRVGLADGVAVVVIQQVVVGQDAQVERAVAVLQLAIGQAAVDGVLRLVRLLEPLPVPPTLNLLDEGHDLLVGHVRRFHQPG